jgi:hypothetical protein
MLGRTRVGLLSRSLLLLAGVTSSALGQVNRATLIGTVRDTGGSPVGLARVISSGRVAVSDTAGFFVLAGLPSGVALLNVRRLGFEPQDIRVELLEGRIDSLSVVLSILPHDLPAVEAEADSRLANYYRHKHSGVGHFFERREIEEKHIQRISDLMRRVPGARLIPDRSGRYQLRMGRSTGRDCPPDFWIDGVRTPFLNVDDIPVEDVEALEIYGGPAGVPPEMNSRLGNPGCGAIIIWTRLPG